MWVIIIGTAGFLWLVLYDIASIKRVKNRSIFAAIGYLSQVFALIASSIIGPKLAMPSYFTFIGWPALIIGTSWMCYCLFIIPSIRRTYWETNEFALLTNGVYGLCRHPGLIGYILMILGLIFVSQSELLLRFGFFWIICDLVHILIQDTFIFPRLFDGYDKYSREVPMLFPTTKSITREWNIYRSNKNA